MLWGAPGDASAVPWAHRSHGAMNSAGKQVVMLPSLRGGFSSPKSQQGAGRGLGGVRSRDHHTPVLCSRHRRAAFPGQQQQDRDGGEFC